MGLNAECGGGSFILKSRNDIEKLEELVSDFLYYGEGETSDMWDRIPFEYEEIDVENNTTIKIDINNVEDSIGEILFSWQLASGNGDLTGVSLSEVENKMAIKIDINNVKDSLEEQGIDWDDFYKVCREMWDDNMTEFSEEQLQQFKKDLNETEDIIDVPLFEHSTQMIENSCIYETKEEHYNSLDEHGEKTLNIVSVCSKEHYWESNASEFIQFESIKDHEAGLKNYVRKIGNSLKKTDLIHLTEFYNLGDKDGETLSVKFQFDVIYNVKKKVFEFEESPSEEDLHPIYEYFSNLKDD